MQKNINHFDTTVRVAFNSNPHKRLCPTELISVPYYYILQRRRVHLFL